ncbi:uncharacterized protein Z520_05861 [Fonsecaea multimorphosa CBS 102226]|uniref:Uncharacterized protein n=1 Tax=Fonsecaea multimorphosa CBS 102226 TaxID=1442371 RepID=A0A0D2H9L4_9EURO|nr:uncharacterized protein Z520_05861 [Fonsecaea multimorphosa CBS 102226]KIX98560.1 hypothetical protein Z520_05861 [Fonsecaea multimorphosa CBS 102226]OAL24751.1 hypothetical protein AYO22_05540 [Fonsecaea multimorphosa]
MSSEQSNAPQFANEKDMETEEVTLQSGEKVTIGRPKGSAAAKAEIQAAMKDNPQVMEAHGPGFTLDVNWPAGQSGSTTPEFQSRTGISKWSIQTGGTFFKYRVWFETDQTYDYQFQDQTHQWYECNVWLKGGHYVDYNSNMPNIQKVSGS